MTLAPTRGVPRTPSHGGGTVTADESGGGGGPPANQPPVIDFSGGNTQLLDPGYYQVLTTIPVGKVAFIMSGSPDPEDAGYTITKWTWSGGTNYSSYTSSPAGQAPPPGVSLGQNVATDQTNYQFIVDSNPREYTIVLDVIYQNGAKGESTLTFTSDAPGGSLGIQQLGTQTFQVIGDKVWIWLQPGIQIDADSSVDADTAGRFMFMQIIVGSDREYVDAAGQSWYRANNANFPGFDGPLIENGEVNLIDYDYTFNGTSNIAGGWALPDSEGYTNMPPQDLPWPYMTDTPSDPQPANFQSVFAQEDFATYLMYQSSMANSDWIAISYIHWFWTEEATKQGGQWNGPTDQQLNPTGPTKPSGTDAFPGWVNTNTAFLQVPYQKGP